jgi:hypothetical protein
MAAGPQGDANLYVGEVLRLVNLRVGPHEDGVAGDAIGVGAELAHTRAGIGDAAPSAGVADYLLPFDEGLILRALLVGHAAVLVGGVNDVPQILDLESLIGPVVALVRHPIVEAHPGGFETKFATGQARRPPPLRSAAGPGAPLPRRR